MTCENVGLLAWGLSGSCSGAHSPLLDTCVMKIQKRVSLPAQAVRQLPSGVMRIILRVCHPQKEEYDPGILPVRAVRLSWCAPIGTRKKSHAAVPRD
jgi:hypothetical protein